MHRPPPIVLLLVGVALVGGLGVTWFNAPAEPNPGQVLDGLQAAVPPGWSAVLIDEPGAMGHTEGLGEPAFRIDVTGSPDVVVACARYLGTPHLRLHFHPRSEEDEVVEAIDAYAVSSDEPPILFHETEQYLVITSPGWINDGNYRPESVATMKPLLSALNAHFDELAPEQRIEIDW